MGSYQKLRAEIVAEIEKWQKALIVLDKLFGDGKPKRGRPSNLEKAIRDAAGQ